MTDPTPITSRLAAADRLVQRERGGGLLLRALPWLFAALVTAFVLDVFLHLGPVARLLLIAGWVVGGLALLGAGWYVAFICRNSAEHTARLLEDREPTLGSKLINLLQLESQTTDATKPPLTRDLAKLAVNGYAEQLAAMNLERVARTDRVRRELKRLGWFALGFGALLGGFYSITLAELPRFADPFGDHPPFSFTRLEITDPSTNAAPVVFRQGAGVRVKHAGHRPDEVLLTFHPPGQPEKAVTVPMFDKGREGFFQQLENIQTDLVVFAHTKNRHSLSKKRTITVLLTPKLDKAYVQVAPPAYTGLAPDERTYQFKNIRALTGSRVQFRLQSNRPLREGVLELSKSPTETERIPLAKSGENEVAGMFEAHDSGRLKFSVVDIAGIASDETLEGSLTVTQDLAPEVSIVNPPKDCFVSMDYKLEAQFEAGDDYGIKLLRIHRAIGTNFLPVHTVAFDKVTRHAREAMLLDFPAMGVKPGDVVTLIAEAVDTAPTPNFARTDPVRITVISEEDYNEFLRQRTDLSDIEAKYADLLDQLHAQTDAQKQLQKEIQALKEKLAAARDPKQKEALQQEFDKLIAKQNELDRKLDKLADNMEQFVRKNPLYDIEADLQKVLAEKAEQIRSSTKQMDAKTGDIAQRSSPPSGGRQLTPEMLEEFKQAAEEQLARLGATEKEGREEVVAPLHEMAQMHELLKDFNRFEQLFRLQEAITEHARAYNRDTPLSREDQLALKDLASAEKKVAEELKRVEERLREDAKGAEKLFPKAAESARELADKIEELRLESLAKQTTSQMLAGAGGKSFQLADRLRGEMEKLFGECNSKGGEMQNELDQHLSLSRSRNPGNSFKQMMQSRKFGGGQGEGLGFGTGLAGTDGDGKGGYVMSAPPAMDVHGNETFLSQAASSNQGGKAGQGQGKPGEGGDTVTPDKPDVVKNVKAVNRQSGAVATESMLGEYAEIVDRYFRALTK
ncbi:MAG: hypothetical protein ABMA26_21520 [Limisphaerales bacterium]